MTSIMPPCPNCGTYHPTTFCPAKPTTNDYNGVKIDIHNPTVNVPANTYSMYDIPSASIYGQNKTPAAAEVK